jgi:hypothetical protein
MRVITKSELGAALQSVGWVRDKYQHLQKTINVTRPYDGFPLGKTTPTQYRIRLETDRCFVDVKSRVTPTRQDPSRTKWTEEERVHYADVVITEGGHIKIGQKTF